MSYPVARVGSVTKKGDTVISGVNNHLVDLGGGVGVTVQFNNQVLVFSEEDTKIFGADEPEDAEGRPASYAAAPNGSGGGAVGDAQPGPTGPPPAPLSADCTDLTGTVPGSTHLSTNFTITQLTQCPAGAHTLQAQAGFTIPQLICNLRALCVNILEPMHAHFGSAFIINSGFRPGSGTSQHQRGEAADCYFPQFDSDQLLAAAVWVQNNLNYDQIILERSVSTGTKWLHVSYDRNRPSQRRKINTCPNAGAGGGVEQYLAGLRKI